MEILVTPRLDHEWLNVALNRADRPNYRMALRSKESAGFNLGSPAVSELTEEQRHVPAKSGR